MKKSIYASAMEILDANSPCNDCSIRGKYTVICSLCLVSDKLPFKVTK